MTTGLYRGVSQDLGEGRHVIGSGEGADLILVEPGLEPCHAAIVLRGETARVEGLAEGVAVAGIGPVPPGSARTVPLPATVTIGTIETAWRAQASGPVSTEAGTRKGLRGLLGRTALPGLATAGLLAAGLSFLGPIADAAVRINGTAKEAIEQFHQVARDGQDAAAHSPTATAAPSETPAGTPGAADPARGPVGSWDDGRSKLALTPRPEAAIRVAASDLQRQAQEGGLLNVRVEARGGAVTATGFVEPALLGRWETLQQGFDERFLGEITLVNSVAVKAEKLPASLGIEGVWRGSQPYIVLRGQRYFLGAVVDGGWMIRAIEHDRVMLEREGRLVAMRF
ncbi:hypothetical protein AKJ13_20950 [Methylobacterium sp. ARG-1]|nr:hypothetical protein AKJ13_20950 [Methylobacterium sp. ARG-1]